MASVFTDQGARVTPTKAAASLTARDAEKDAKVRNARAEDLGIQTRYVVREGE